MKAVVPIITLLVVTFLASVACASSVVVPPATPAKPVVVVPVQRMQFTDGRYLVANEQIGTIVPLPPGEYATNGEGDWRTDINAGACTWSLWRNNNTVFSGAGFAPAGETTTVRVDEWQQFTVRGGCTWDTVATGEDVSS